MTDERKLKISQEVRIAMEEEVISGATLAKCFKVPPTYISNIHNPKKHHLVPLKVWEMLDEWRISGEDLRTFGLCRDNANVKVPPIPQETRDALQDEIDKMEVKINTESKLEGIHQPIVDNTATPPRKGQMQRAVQEFPPLMEHLRDILQQLEELGYQPHFTLNWKEEI